MSEAGPSTSGSTPIQEKDKDGTESFPNEMNFTLHGIVFTSGQGVAGQLGDKGVTKTEFTSVESLPIDIVQIAAGDEHTVCLSARGLVWTFGSNDFGALGRDVHWSNTYKPAQVPLSGKVIQISAGDGHTAALMEDGNVYMWGLFRDAKGYIKEINEPIEKFSTPYLLDVPDRIIKISSGGDHLLLLTVLGKVLSVGCADQGQLGRISRKIIINARNSRSGFIQMVKPHTIYIKRCKFFDNIWATQYGSLLRDRDMGIFVFGLNDHGQLGVPVADCAAIYQPKKSYSLSNDRFSWIKIVGNACNTILLNITGQVYSLGQGEHGLLGLGLMFDDVAEPTLVQALLGKKIVDIGCGSTVFYAVSENGSVFTWGFGSAGQMGAGDEFYSWEPQQITSEELERGNFKILQADGGDKHGVLLAKK